MALYIIGKKSGIFFNKMKQIAPNNPKRVSYCLQTASLSTIVKKAHQIAAFEKQLSSFIPEKIIPHCRVMNIAGKTLILQLDSGTFSTRIRYLIPDLLEAFERQKVPITTILCRIRP